MVSPDPLLSRLRAAGCVWADEEAALIRDASADEDQATQLAARRADGEPLEQVLGWVAFGRRRVRVAPAVFVPRRRTELVATLAVGAVDRSPAASPVLVDLCTGAGAIAAAVVARRPALTVHAVDLDPAAVACARTNLPGAAVYLGDLDTPLPHTLRGAVDVLTACAPYVPSAAVDRMPSEARDHEPLVALDGGADGLDVVRRVIACAPGLLRPGGSLLVEVADDQVDAGGAALDAAGLDPSVARDPERDAVALVGRRSGDPS